jgi:hypothetical protein
MLWSNGTTFAEFMTEENLSLLPFPFVRLSFGAFQRHLKHEAMIRVTLCCRRPDSGGTTCGRGPILRGAGHHQALHDSVQIVRARQRVCRDAGRTRERPLKLFVLLQLANFFAQIRENFFEQGYRETIQNMSQLEGRWKTWAERHGSAPARQVADKMTENPHFSSEGVLTSGNSGFPHLCSSLSFSSACLATSMRPNTPIRAFHLYSKAAWDKSMSEAVWSLWKDAIEDAGEAPLSTGGAYGGEAA